MKRRARVMGVLVFALASLLIVTRRKVRAEAGPDSFEALGVWRRPEIEYAFDVNPSPDETSCDDRKGFVLVHNFGALGDGLFGAWVCDASASESDYKLIIF